MFIAILGHKIDIILRLVNECAWSVYIIDNIEISAWNWSVHIIDIILNWQQPITTEVQIY